MKTILYVTPETLADISTNKIVGFLASPTPKLGWICALILPLKDYVIHEENDLFRVSPVPKLKNVY